MKKVSLFFLLSENGHVCGQRRFDSQFSFFPVCLRGEKESKLHFNLLSLVEFSLFFSLRQQTSLTVILPPRLIISFEYFNRIFLKLKGKSGHARHIIYCTDRNKPFSFSRPSGYTFLLLLKYRLKD